MSSVTSPKLKLDTSETPRWDLTLVVRGVDVPTLSPLTAADRSIVNLGERRPGAAVRLWRWLFGEPRRTVDDDHETRELRRTVAAFTPPEHRRLLAAMGGGELMAVLGNYVGAQAAWYAQVEREARESAELAWEAYRAEREQAMARAAGAVGAGGGVGVGAGGVGGGRRVKTPPMKLVPGGPLPAMAAGLVDDFRTKAGQPRAEDQVKGD